jgi:glucokinase
LQQTKLGLVADVGGTNIRLALVEYGRGVVGETRTETPSSPTPARVLNRIAEMMTWLPGGVELASGLVLGIPGLVDADQGVVLANANLGWRNVALQCLAEERFGLPAMIQNDVRLHTLGEWRFGAGRGLTSEQSMADVVIGTGLAMGLVSGGRLLNAPQSGEVGHVTWDRSGVRCGCGKIGCVETVVGAKALRRRYREHELPADDFAVDVVGALKNNASEALGIWQEFCQALAFGLSMIVMLIHPDLIVLSGGVVQSLPLWEPILIKALEEQLFPGSLNSFQIIASKLADSAPYLGGMSLLFDAPSVP